MVWQPRANCWVYHPITNGLYWPKGSAKFANLEQNALKHFLTSAEGRVEGNMFFCIISSFSQHVFFCSTLFFSQNRHVQKRFFSTVLFCIISFFPSTTKKRVFPQQRKNMFLSKPNPCRRRRENLLCFNYSFWRSGFSKKNEKEKRKEGTEKKGGRMHSLCQKRRVFFPASLERRKKAKPPGLSWDSTKPEVKKFNQKMPNISSQPSNRPHIIFGFLLLLLFLLFFALLCWCSTTWVA